MEPGASVSAIAHRIGIHPRQHFLTQRSRYHCRRLSSSSQPTALPHSWSAASRWIGRRLHSPCS
nr:hypothetical protein [Rhizobium leguminosarum]